MSLLDNKLKMLGYTKLMYNSVAIYNNKNRGSLVIVDKYGKDKAYNYSTLGNLDIAEMRYQLVIKLNMRNNNSCSDNMYINITIDKHGEVHVLDQSSCILELEKVIIMGNGFDIFMYDKATKRKYSYIGDRSKDKNVSFYHRSHIKIINRHYLFINNTYVDFCRKEVYKFRPTMVNSGFIATSGENISKEIYSMFPKTVLKCIGEKDTIEFNCGDTNIVSTEIKFIINLRSGEVCRVLDTAASDDKKYRLKIENLHDGKIGNITGDKSNFIRFDH